MFSILFSLNSCKNNEPTDILPTIIQLNETNLSLIIGGREKLLTTTDPVNASLSGAKWTSSDTTVATVDKDGVIKAIAVGTSTIQLTIGNLSDNCKLQVVTSPVTGLIMPDVKYPIMNGATILLQGKGFTSTQKLWLRKNDVSTSAKVREQNSSMKAGKADGDILATIHEQTANYISFYAANTSNGWYSVILDNVDAQFNLGNIQISTQVVPEYKYDMNKIFWDDTHWRRFQLRGNVKEMKVKNSYIQDYGSSYQYEFIDNSKISFSRKGLLVSEISYYDSILFIYDKMDRLIEQAAYTFHYANNSKSIIKYTYDDHSLYSPIKLWHKTFRDRHGADDDAIIWVKGLNSIDYVHEAYKDKTSNTQKVVFTVNSNTIVEDDLTTFKDDNTRYKSTYTYNYVNNFPVKMTEVYDNYFDASSGISAFRLTGKNETTLEFGTNGMLFKTVLSADNKIYESNYNRSSPFYLLQSKGNNVHYEYDKNWNLIKVTNSYSTTDFYYQSYDEYGNWTQLKIIYKSTNNYMDLYVISREFVYW